MKEKLASYKFLAKKILSVLNGIDESELTVAEKQIKAICETLLNDNVLNSSPKRSRMK